MQILELAAVVALFLDATAGRKHRRPNEIGVTNLLGKNAKLRCQSLRTDLSDRFLNRHETFRFKFYDIDRGDMHFWCDVYALGGFDSTFDAFGGFAPLRQNMTCTLSWRVQLESEFSTEPICEAPFLIPKLDPHHHRLSGFIRHSGVQLDFANATLVPWRELSSLLASLPNSLRRRPL